METRILTIMLTDIQGFTQRTSSSSREALRQLLDEHERLLFPVIGHYGGTLVKTIGDALLVTFSSPTNAVLCGLAMQERLAAHNFDKPEPEQLHVRVALNSGEVQIRDGDVFGEAVNITARIEGITEAGEIYFTESVYLAMNKSEVPSSEVGEKRLKGLPEAIRVYKVIRDPLSDQYRQLQEKMLGLDLDEGARPHFAVAPGAAAATTEELAQVLAGGPTPRQRHIRTFAIVGGLAVLLLIAAIAAFVLLRDPLAGDLAALDDALAGNAYSRAMAIASDLVVRFPGDARAHDGVGRVVRAEVLALSEKNEHPEALTRLDFHEGKLEPRTFPELRKNVLLAFGAERAKDWLYRRVAPIYGELLDRHGDDPAVLRTIMRVMGHEAPDGATRIALNAAVAYMANTAEPVDAATAGLVFAYLTRRQNDAFSRSAVKYREMLVARYPDAAKDAAARLGGDCAGRVHPFLILKGADKLGAPDRLGFYFTLLHDDCRGASNLADLRAEAIAYVGANAGRPDWSAIKRDAGIGPLNEIKQFRRGGFFARPEAKALVKGFLPEIEALLLRGAAERTDRFSDEDFQRTNAWEIAKLAGLAANIDAWSFHRESLLSYGGRFKPDLIDEAIGYFAGQDGKAEAKAVLIEARDYLAERIATYKQKTGYEPGDFIKEYHADVEAALAKM